MTTTPTTRKRMILTLDEDLHAVLMELSKVTGTPAATYVTRMLEDIKPIIQGTTRILIKAQSRSNAAHH